MKFGPHVTYQWGDALNWAQGRTSAPVILASQLLHQAKERSSDQKKNMPAAGAIRTPQPNNQLRWGHERPQAGECQPRYTAPANCGGPTCLSRWFDDGQWITARGEARSPCHRTNRGQGLHHLRAHQSNEGAMPARSKGPRLYLRRARRDNEGGHASIWLILDGKDEHSTGCPAHDIAGAEQALAKYLASKHARAVRQGGSRNPDQIPIADVLTFYLTNVVPGHARPEETKGRIKALDRFSATGCCPISTARRAAPTWRSDRQMRQPVVSLRICARRLITIGAKIFTTELSLLSCRRSACPATVG